VPRRPRDGEQVFRKTNVVGEKRKSMSDRPGSEKNPYLLRHVGNSVDWRPWGEDVVEIFSDEFDGEDVCKNRGEGVYFDKCVIYGEGGEPIPVKGA